MASFRLLTERSVDRVNIGNARLYGLEADLGMAGNQYQVAVSVLFVTYIIFEIPSNLVLKKLTPRRYIAAIMLAWGILAACTGAVQSYGGLIAMRLLLGVVEAGMSLVRARPRLGSSWLMVS